MPVRRIRPRQAFRPRPYPLRAPLMTPRQLESNIVLKHRYRFTSTSGTATQLTPASLLLAAGGMGTSAVQVSSFFGSLKVKSIEIFSPVSAQGSATTCSIEWAGSVSAFLADREISDTSVSTAMPAHVKSRPPRGSLASFWQTSSANTLCALTAPVGSIIDIALDLTLYDDNGNIPQAVTAVTTAVLGTVYYLTADSVVNHRYTPVSLTTTT